MLEEFAAKEEEEANAKAKGKEEKKEKGKSDKRKEDEEVGRHRCFSFSRTICKMIITVS